MARLPGREADEYWERTHGHKIGKPWEKVETYEEQEKREAREKAESERKLKEAREQRRLANRRRRITLTAHRETEDGSDGEQPSRDSDVV